MLRNPDYKRRGQGACHYKPETSRLVGLCVFFLSFIRCKELCACHTRYFLSGLWLGFPVAFAADSFFSSTKRGLGAHRCGIGGSSIAGSLRRRSHPLSLYPSSHLLMNVLSHSLPSLLNSSGRSWQNYTIRDHNQVTFNNVSLLRA